MLFLGMLVVVVLSSGWSCNGFITWRSPQMRISPPFMSSFTSQHFRIKNKTPSSPTIPLSQQIFCNVELKGSYLEAIGFDMDFTLAQYNEEFDKLAFEGAKQNLVNKKGYPSEVLDFQYDSTLFTRGLVIDKPRGNFLKMDRHKYVRKLYHGLTPVSRQERKEIYLQSYAYMPSFSESDFVNIDTIFLLVDALLFAQLVDLKDRTGNAITKTYSQLFEDVRACVDICHKDGVIKDVVKKNPAKYIIYDPNTLPMLLKLKNAGIKVFLLTNSLYDYSDTVMNYLIHGNGTVYQSQVGITSTDGSDKKLAWQQLFDVAIVGAGKPGFISEDYLSLYRVDKDGMLENIEDKDSLRGIDCKLMDGGGCEASTKKNMNVFQGGCWPDLYCLLSISSPDKILYVGDHMYADILKSRRTLGWRTCLIIPELEKEITVYNDNTHLADEIRNLRNLQYDLDQYVDSLRQRVDSGVPLLEQFTDAEAKAVELKERLLSLTAQYDSQYNSIWGPLFKAGYQDSRFARQVLNYACLYTSKASNLVYVSPRKSFRPVQDFMAHDQVLFESEEMLLQQRAQ